MAQKQPARRKHVPRRTCVGCRQVLAKRELIRVVRTPEGVFVDPTGRTSGRGAYIHDRRDCWALALKGRLAGALRISLDPEDVQRLEAHMATLTDT